MAQKHRLVICCRLHLSRFSIVEMPSRHSVGN